MKKLMTVMLGLSMLVGTTALFAADKDAKDTTKSTAKGKKGGKKKSTDKTATAPKS